MDGRLMTHITCYNCGRKGHYADNCLGQNSYGTNKQQHVQVHNDNSNDLDAGEVETNEQHMSLQHKENSEDIVHFSWTQIMKDVDNKYKETDILIDTGSMFSVFKNPQMRKMKAYTNGGSQDSTLVGELSGFFRVWYNPKSMINILAWSDIANKYRITSDTTKGR